MTFTRTLLALSLASTLCAANAENLQAVAYTGNLDGAVPSGAALLPYATFVNASINGSSVGLAHAYEVAAYDTSTPTPTYQHSFLALCMEMGKTLGAAAWDTTTYSTVAYTPVTYTPSAAVQHLFNEYYDDVVGATTTADIALWGGAFQLALWDLISDAGSYTLTSGAVQATPTSLAAYAAASTAAISQANTMLGNVQTLTLGNSAPVARYSLTQWDSATTQDFLQATAVPEPSAYALIAAGLGVVAFAQRRRLTQAA